ncbi:unnamed protein product [Microthlaspi erraticum]|uniref:Uncharacterized protein n=1 Tax=Microthlaspi erraticum TaxID=1685480 RepID=A0A6D2JP97_9BRAS|nr:unnamed protein product [Microthlaspi erraticum]
MVRRSDNYSKKMIRRWEDTKEEEIDGYRDGGFKLSHFVCDGDEWPSEDGALIKRYARLGLHSYNLLHGTNLHFHSVKSFDKRFSPSVPTSDFYITVAAREPPSLLKQNFQVEVDEECYRVLDLTCSNVI